eukprot:s1516_g1.t1
MSAMEEGWHILPPQPEAGKQDVLFQEHLQRGNGVSTSGCRQQPFEDLPRQASTGGRGLWAQEDPESEAFQRLSGELPNCFQSSSDATRSAMFTDKIAAAVDQARNDAASAIERHVERAKASSSGFLGAFDSLTDASERPIRHS